MEYLNFSWILEGSLAGAQGPTQPRDFTFLKINGIRAVVRMEENTISAEPYELLEMYEPVPDFTPPTMEQMHRIVRFIEDQIENWERPVVVTCAAGLGRTGTVLASYMVNVGHQPDAAIKKMRELRPGSIQSREQEQAVRDYAEYLGRGNR